MRADELITNFKLIPHPEGGFYRELYRSENILVTERGERAALTTILFLLRRGEVSEFHRVASDEVWHFLEGEPLRLVSLTLGLEEVVEYQLGSGDPTRTPVAVIKKNHWQGAESLGEYSLVGCTVGPGFDFKDFSLMRDSEAVVGELNRRYPQLRKFVRA